MAEAVVDLGGQARVWTTTRAAVERLGFREGEQVPVSHTVTEVPVAKGAGLLLT